MSDPHYRTPDPLIRRVTAALLLVAAVVVGLWAPAHPNGLTFLTVALAATGVWLIRRDLAP